MAAALICPEGTLSLLDWLTVLAIDHDPKACEVYRANIACERVVCGDLVDHLDSLPSADVILGGPPCQPYSSAGKQQGDRDARDCIPDFCAAIERVKPRQFLMEEVDAFAEQEKFQPVLHRTVARLTAAGYDVEMRVLDAVNYGVPQFRRRAWLWGIRKDLPWVLRHRKWPTPTHAWPWPEACMFGGELHPAVVVGEALELSGWTDRYGRLRDCSRDAVGEASVAIVRPRQTGAREIAGLDEPSCALSSTRTDEHRLMLKSHADPARTIDQPAPALRSGGGGHDGCRVELYRWSNEMLSKHPPASPASPASPAPAVQAKWAKGGAEGLLRVVGAGRNDARGTDGKFRREERDITDEPSTTLTGKYMGVHPGAQNPRGIERDGLQVRRLTPAECARLQSMPDDFVWPESVAKTHRYRIIGNGWASGMALHMSLALKHADPSGRTVIDLFCGGGCGAVGWHGRAWQYAGTEERRAVG